MLNLTVLVVALLQASPSAACEVYGDEAASACRAGVSKCCARAAISLIHRRPDRCEGAPNPLLAARLATMGCDGGDGVSCSLLAAEAERRTPGFPPPDRSSALWSRGHELGGAACGGGDAEACLALARSAREGVRQPKDPKLADQFEARARELFGASCAKLDPAACEEGAVMDLVSGSNLDGALGVLQDLCKRGRASACTRTLRARTVALSAKQQLLVEEILRDGCLRGGASACSDLARLARRRSASEALEWDKRACEAGNGFGCHLVADSLATGTESDEWRKKGCANGVAHLTCPPAPGKCVSPEQTWPLGFIFPSPAKERDPLRKPPF